MTVDIANMIVHLARLAQNGGNTGLTAAQWTALRFFARANRFSRTPSAFSEFHATTRGTASQTVKSLVAMGLLRRLSNASDARSTLIEVTDAGHAMLREDPLRDLNTVLSHLPPETRRILEDALNHATAELAALRDAPTFGNCTSCAHCKTRSGEAYCHCTQSILGQEDMVGVCIDFDLATRAEPPRLNSPAVK